MDRLTIRQVSEEFSVTPRTLRYYEQIGLLESMRTEGGAYRVYDAASTERLRQILLLRRLRIPLRQIRDLLSKREIGPAIALFRRRLDAIDREAGELAGLRTLLAALIRRLEECSVRQRLPEPPETDALQEVFRTLSGPVGPSGNPCKEEAPMPASSEALSDVRILTLPPATVAASHYIGESPEGHASEPLDAFIRRIRLWERKPDLRHFGFNHPNPSPDSPVYGYEMWVTIPDGLDVPAPLEKKTLPGGLYAAHKIEFPNFHEWQWLVAWVRDNPDYTFNMPDDGGECMNGMLEEHLNYAARIREGVGEEGMQLDLLLPIRRRG